MYVIKWKKGDPDRAQKDEPLSGIGSAEFKTPAMAYGIIRKYYTNILGDPYRYTGVDQDGNEVVVGDEATDQEPLPAMYMSFDQYQDHCRSFDQGAKNPNNSQHVHMLGLAG